MKKVDVYGVKMTSIQEMRFSQFLNNGKVPAMNTLTKEARCVFAKNWKDNFSCEKVT